MSELTAPQQLSPVYHCQSDTHQYLQAVKQHLHHVCAQHANRLVKVETVDGDVFEGHIVHIDKSILYLSLSNDGADRAFLPGFGFPGNFILPLVLYDLLAISLFI
ncbi:hypothetical protein COLU111180_13850 [Cohnella lubricantis]|uniref:Uncharacterized protein n=1 Tax=Cohnella lubricantis TaxID=2163172 RepID=A0A841TCV7_9BACL|nr:hypothetical protein [Cohnella lubricantis]MBB6678016.1 hypothetical protein [Cohnella lubricantis]MBP2118149.1 arginase family enzyme [Cohnella lubricantis]